MFPHKTLQQYFYQYIFFFILVSTKKKRMLSSLEYVWICLRMERVNEKVKTVLLVKRLFRRPLYCHYQANQEKTNIEILAINEFMTVDNP